MVRVTCSSGYPSLSQPLVCLRWGFLTPLIALSLDGVFRGCFAVDFSPFLPFRWLGLLFSFFICKPRPVTTLVTISSQFRYRFILSDGTIGKGKGLALPSHSAFHSDHGEFTIFTPVFPWGYFTCLSVFYIVLGLSRVVYNKPFLLSFGKSYVFLVYCGSLP